MNERKKKRFTRTTFPYFCALLWFEVCFEVIGLPDRWKEILYFVVNVTTFQWKLWRRVCDRNAAQSYKRFPLKDTLDSCFSSQLEWWSGVYKAAIAAQPQAMAELVIPLMFLIPSHLACINTQIPSLFYIQWWHDHASKSHGNHAVFRSCRMVTTSVFPASLLENLCRIPVQSIKYRQTAHLVYSSVSL